MDIVRQLLPIILMLGLMYFMLFLPEKKRKAAFTKMISELKINDEVTTRGGIIGKIVKLDEETIIRRVREELALAKQQADRRKRSQLTDHV